MIRRSLAVFGTVGALLLAMINFVYAQDVGPQAVDVQQAAMGTAFTYQGQLKSGGAGVTGPCEMAFRLYDAVTAGNPIGSPITQTVTVNAGLFTTQLDFGASAFNGQARWLETAVKCGSDTVFTTLSRQALTPAPYALYATSASWSGLSGIPPGFADGIDNDTVYTATTGLTLIGNAFGVNFGGTGVAPTVARSDHSHTNFWRTNGNSQTDPAVNFIGTTDNVTLTLRANNQTILQLAPNATSPNIIGGYSGNAISNTLAGATIAGGGNNNHPNRVSGNYGAVGGGINNSAAYYAVVAGGNDNTASGEVATIGGGYRNQVSGWYATIAGGTYNSVDGDYATASGGASNHVSGWYGTVAGGASNSVDSDYATIAGGASNSASGKYSSIAGGYGAVATQYGESAYANGYFTSTPGTAQTSQYVLRGTSTGTTFTTLHLDGSASASQVITVPVGHAATFEILLIGRTENGLKIGAYSFQGFCNSESSGVSIGSTIPYQAEYDTAWGAQLAEDDPNHALLIQVWGNTGDIVRWVAYVRTVEVGW